MATNSLQDRYNDFLAFCAYWIPAYGPAPFMLGGQNAPRPANPYVTVEFFTNVEQLGTVERRMDYAGNEWLRTQLSVGVDLFAFSGSDTRFDGSNNAGTLLQNLKTSLRVPDVYNRLTEITFRLLDDDMVADNSRILNTTYEPAASMSLTFSTITRTDIDNGSIETIEGGGTLDSGINDRNVNISVTE